MQSNRVSPVTTHESRLAPFQLALAVFLLCCGTAAAQTAGKPAVDYSAVPKLQALKERDPAPDFTLQNADGKKVSIKDFRGKVVFLNFWASWCEGCREEMPSMERLYKEFKGKGLEIVAVNVKEQRPVAMAFYKKYQLTYPLLLDGEGQVGLLYGAFGLPVTYLIDRKGMVLARLWGPADWYSPGARNLIGSLLQQ